MAVQTSYIDPTGNRKTGWIINGQTYKDDAGLDRVDVGSIVSTGGGEYILTDSGGIKYSDYLAQQKAATAKDPAAYYQQALGSQRNSIAANTEANLAALENQLKQTNVGYNESLRQAAISNDQQGRRLADSLASTGVYNSGYSDSARLQLAANYGENRNEIELARRKAVDDIETAKTQTAAAARASEAEAESTYYQLLAQQLNADRSYNYGRERDALSDARYDNETAYGRERDALSDARYDSETAYGRERDALSDARYDSETAYGRERDALSDERYDSETAYGRERDALSDARYDSETAYNKAITAAQYGDYSLLADYLGVSLAMAQQLYDSDATAMLRQNAQDATSGVEPSIAAKNDTNMGGKYSDGDLAAKAAREAGIGYAQDAISRGVSYNDAVEKMDFLRDTVEAQYGTTGWDAYKETILNMLEAQYYPLSNPEPTQEPAPSKYGAQEWHDLYARRLEKADKEMLIAEQADAVSGLYELYGSNKISWEDFLYCINDLGLKATYDAILSGEG